VEKEDILEGKLDSLMRRLEKMEIENKEAKVLDYMRKGICRTFSMGKVDLKLMQAHLFRIRFHFVYN
jgi:hypothetical protein